MILCGLLLIRMGAARIRFDPGLILALRSLDTPVQERKKENLMKMNHYRNSVLSFAWALASTAALAAPAATTTTTTPAAGNGGGHHGNGPCEQIIEACKTAGFIVGEAKEGKGLWKDCVAGIVGNPKAGKSAIALPNVSSTIVSECKTKHPNFGEGHGKGGAANSSGQ